MKDMPRSLERLFDACDRGEGGDRGVACCSWLSAYLYWILFTSIHVEIIASALRGTLISSPGVEINEEAIHLDALDRYRKSKVHFVDCLIAATASAENTPVATFDQDFRKFADVRVETQ